MGHVWFGGSFDKWIHGFHMPLWFIISGFFFHTKSNLSLYVKRKAKSILVPYLILGISYEIIWVLAGYNQWLGMIWPNSIEVPLNGALWFLPALFAVDIICVSVLGSIKRNVAYIVLSVLAALGSFHFVSLPFSLDSALVGCGFFLIGHLIRQYVTKLLRIKNALAICLLMIASVLIMLNGYVNVRTNEYAVVPLFWINAVLATISLCNICRWIFNLRLCQPVCLVLFKKVTDCSIQFNGNAYMACCRGCYYYFTMLYCKQNHKKHTT